MYQLVKPTRVRNGPIHYKHIHEQESRLQLSQHLSASVFARLFVFLSVSLCLAFEEILSTEWDYMVG